MFLACVICLGCLGSVYLSVFHIEFVYLYIYIYIHNSRSFKEVLPC